MNNIVIKQYKKINSQEVLNLYESVGWTNYTQNFESLLVGLKNSIYVVGAFSDGKLIGLVRCVGDGITIILIQDLLILPEYQQNGIGKELIKNVLNKYKNVYQIQLITDNANSNAKKLYNALGFKHLDELGCCGYMKLNNNL